MNTLKQFVLKKKDDRDTIIYEKSNTNSCYEINPVTPIKLDNMIDIEKIVIISSDLVNILISKKVKKNLEKILKLLAIIYDDDSDDDGILNLALDEINKFRQRIADKFQEYMDEQEHKLILKKLEILESEIKLRKQALDDYKKMLKEGKPKPKKVTDAKQIDITDIEEDTKAR